MFETVDAVLIWMPVLIFVDFKIIFSIYFNLFEFILLFLFCKLLEMYAQVTIYFLKLYVFLLSTVLAEDLSVMFYCISMGIWVNLFSNFDGNVFFVQQLYNFLTNK